jgi:hypothetical protein
MEKKGQEQETWDELKRRLRRESVEAGLVRGETYAEMDAAWLDMMGPLPPDMK